MAFGIYMSDALELLNQTSGQTFDITYRKQGGVWGEKKGVRRQAGKAFESKGEKPIGNKNKTNIDMAPKLMLVDADGQRFEIWKCLLLSINGKLIDKRF